MGGRSHDFHCPGCHTWEDAWSADEHGMRCLDCGVAMFYDLNLDGCGTDECPDE